MNLLPPGPVTALPFYNNLAPTPNLARPGFETARARPTDYWVDYDMGISQCSTAPNGFDNNAKTPIGTNSKSEVFPLEIPDLLIRDGYRTVQAVPGQAALRRVPHNGPFPITDWESPDNLNIYPGQGVFMGFVRWSANGNHQVGREDPMSWDCVYAKEEKGPKRKKVVRYRRVRINYLGQRASPGPKSSWVNPDKVDTWIRALWDTSPAQKLAYFHNRMAVHQREPGRGNEAIWRHLNVLRAHQNYNLIPK